MCINICNFHWSRPWNNRMFPIHGLLEPEMSKPIHMLLNGPLTPPCGSVVHPCALDQSKLQNIQHISSILFNFMRFSNLCYPARKPICSWRRASPSRTWSGRTRPVSSCSTWSARSRSRCPPPSPSLAVQRSWWVCFSCWASQQNILNLMSPRPSRRRLLPGQQLKKNHR